MKTEVFNMAKINASAVYNIHETKTFYCDFPKTCPICHAGYAPYPVLANYANIAAAPFETYNCRLMITNYCPACEKMYLTFFLTNQYDTSISKLELCEPHTLVSSDFPECIKNLSPEYCQIYTQSVCAEQNGLFHICGMGYRKALEFLIKDYMITRLKEDSNVIQKESLSACINKLGNETLIKLSKACAWLGNDETHYQKKFTDKNLTDLKALLNATQKYIETVFYLEDAESILNS